MTEENTKEWWQERYSASGDQYLYSKEPSAFLQRQIDLLPSKGVVVDLGCGEGRNAILMAQKGLNVTGIDISEAAIERAKRLAQDSGVEVEFKVADLDFFLPPLMTYDAILCSNFKAPMSLLNNLIRSLKQNGRLLIENWTMKASQENPNIEAWECFKPGELLSLFSSKATNFLIEFYSELGEERSMDRVQFIARKTEMI